MSGSDIKLLALEAELSEQAQEELEELSYPAGRWLMVAALELEPDICHDAALTIVHNEEKVLGHLLDKIAA